MKLPKFTGIRLQSDIEQCEAALADKTHSLQRGCASVQKDLRSLRKKFEKAKDSRDLPKLKKLKEKRDLLRLKVEALERGRAVSRRAAKAAQPSREALHEKHEHMHGLLAYGMSTGSLSPDAELLFNTLGDLLGAKTEGDRASANKAVDLILEHGNILGKEEETGACDDEALRRFENLSDPEERSAFFNQNRDEILRGFDARKNNS
jgi:hypothetical protein